MNDMANKYYDVVVVGGGMSGAATALGLALAGWSIALVEHQEPRAFVKQNPPDLRISAINCASVKLLKKLGAWPEVLAMRAAPYRRIETWEWGASCVVFDAASLGLPELGFMVENNILKLALWKQFARRKNLLLRCPAHLKSIQRSSDRWCLTLDSAETIKTRLIVAADGTWSQVRQLAGIGINGWEYRQSCMIITIETDTSQKDTTWQQFFPSGPRAFMPLCNQWAALAWYDNPQRIRQLQAMPALLLQGVIIEAFPKRLGTIRVHAIGSFPLVRCHAQRYILPGLVLLGDAAHTIHPLGGQGLNLSYRDVDVILDVLNKAREQGEDWSQESILIRYQRQRRLDNLLMQDTMDLFHSVFRKKLAPLRLARNIALMAAQRSGKLKMHALKYALGL